MSDVLMPGLDGFQLCLAIRREPRLAHIPVVLASASYVEEADRALARKVGASGLVFQPNVDGLTAGWQGGAVVRSLTGKRLIAVVNVEAQSASAGSADWLSTYVGFPQ